MTATDIIIGICLGVISTLFILFLFAIRTTQNETKPKPPIPQPRIIRGYQPIGDLDLSNPPRGGTGMFPPVKKIETVRTSFRSK